MKKPTKQQREARRALHANIYSEGFEKGWELRGKIPCEHCTEPAKKDVSPNDLLQLLLLNPPLSEE